jgi:hypothetical protein
MGKVYSTLDVYIASWIYLDTGIYPELQNHSGKVSFYFPLTDEIIKFVSNYNSGINVVLAAVYGVKIPEKCHQNLHIFIKYFSRFEFTAMT